MSIQAISWALKVQGLKSTEKFVLVCLSNYANENGYCFPSVAQISEDTCQDRKTVLSNIKSLCATGLITDSGKRVGATKQIIVYKVNSTEIGTVNKSTEIGTGTENGTVPFLEPNSTVFPPKQSQKRDTDPSGTVSNRQRAHKSPTTPKSVRATRIPEDFLLTDERRLVAEAEKLPAERTFEKFRDYWLAASGAKARKICWEATWRNWCKTEADRRPTSVYGKPPAKDAYRGAV